MKAAFSIYLLLSWGQLLKGQASFLDYRYTWNETYSCYGFPYVVESYRFTIDSSSKEIAGRSFYEVLRSPTMTGDNFEQTGNYVSRMDSNKVYSYYDNEIKLLFDYSLEEGDTFITHNMYDCVLIVGDIDTVLLLNGAEKRKWIFYFSGDDYHPEWESGYPYWIEGIGNQYGLFGNEQFCIIDGCGSGLLCVHFESELIFNTWPANDSCWYITGLEQPNDAAIEIRPNPASSKISIDCKNHFLQKVSIIDLLGNVLFIGNESPVDISFLPPGYYFFRIELENSQIFMKRFVKL